jgi:hypothetical protein
LATNLLAELTAAIRASSRASTRLLKAAKSADHPERRREAMKSWLTAQERRRRIWRAMATPVTVGDDLDKR